VTEIFKAAAHNEGFQVREFEFDPTAMGQQLEELERLQCDKDHLHKILQQWCYASYGEVTHSLSNVLSNIKDLCLSI
jgi:V-type H+-transporting ATPase subunit C